MLSTTLNAHAREKANPMALVRTAVEGAEARKVHMPSLMSLATADATGMPSNRIVRVLEFRDDGFVFTSHTGSLKGRQMAENNWASGLIYWPEINQQIVISGRTQILSDVESDALWGARSYKTHPMSTASMQSEPLRDERELAARAEALEIFDQPLPRPRSWVGYLVEPTAIEFWHAGPKGLHQRIEFIDNNGWQSRQLQP